MANSDRRGWATVAVLTGRLIFAAVFILAVTFKLKDPNGTSTYIASAGFPVPDLLTWLAVLLELGLIACLLTGAFFAEAALLAAAYVLFLGFAFHGPSRGKETRRSSVSSSITSPLSRDCSLQRRMDPGR